MKKSLPLLLTLILITSLAFSQTCPGDVVILENENLVVWDVYSNDTEVFSLASFVGDINVGDSTYFSEDIGAGETGLVLMAHDLSGTLLWNRQIEGAGFFTTNPGITASASNVYVAATSAENDNTVHNFRIESYQISDGEPVWANSYQTPVTTSNLPFGAQVNPYSMGIDGSNNIYVSGAFSGVLDIGVTTLTTTPGLSETFVMAVNGNDGTDLWATQSNGSNGRGRAWTLEVTLTNEIIIGGHFTGSIDFGGTPYVAADNTTVNPYIAKINAADGSEIWVEAFEGQTAGSFNNIYDITLDPTGNVFYAGAFHDVIDVQGNTVNSASAGEGGTDALIGAMDPNGTYLWANQLGGVSTSDEFATTIVFSGTATSLYVGVQLVTDQLFYGNNLLAYPELSGHYVFGVLPVDGSIDANLGNNITNENNFGYSAQYLDATDTYISASLINGSGTNTKVAQWIPNRPIPIVDVTLEDGILNPTETLTAFDPGGGNYTFQWFLNGNPIPGQTTALYTSGINGEYYVEIAGAGGCPLRSESFFLLDGTTLESDSLALVELYNNTDGPNWIDNTNWLQPGTLVQDWFGVVLQLGRVKEINLISNNLNGLFPASIFTVSNLTDLRLGGNNITGQLPEDIGNLTNLTGLEVWGNQMSGPIPPSIGDITGLLRFWATDNNFSGSLPTEIGNLTQLEGLAFNDNQITGPFPASIQNMTSATYFEFVNNPINDVIPDELGLMPAMANIQLENAQLTGSIPTSLGNLSNLNNLVLANNQLIGSIPTELGNLTALSELNLNSNQLDGTVPASLGNTALVNFGIQFNNISGTFPDEIWQIPTLQYIQVDNNFELTVDLPANLSSLTQLVDIRLDNTLPRGGDFPTALYDLPNLVGLSLGNKGYTGTLDGAGVDNWVNLDNIYLWNSELTGDLPAEFAQLPNLRAIGVFGNSFQNIPDFVGAGSPIQELDVARNQLDFNSIAPNLSIATFLFSPQSRRGENLYLEVDEGGTLDLTNDYSASGNVYQWVRNINDSISTDLNYQITDATLDDLGGYFAYVTNPSVPELTLLTKFYNVAFFDVDRSFTVDNSPNSIADFKSFYSALYGTNAGDTLLVSGSETDYNIGGFVLERPRVIFGPGYFINDNPETQASDTTARIRFINLRTNADGSQIYGMDIESLFLNNVGSASDDVLSSITISNNRISEFAIVDDADDIKVSENFIKRFDFSSTSVAGTSRNYTNIELSNNIIDTVGTSISQATAARNDMTNVVFSRNTINVFLDSIQDASLDNNVINQYDATNNTVTNTQSFAAAGLTGSELIDNEFQTADGFGAGAFSGDDPYQLSGIDNIPHIFSLTDIGRIRINALGKNPAGNTIDQLNYKLGENGNVVATGTVNRLTAGNPVDVVFRPKVGQVTPGGNIRLMIWAEDNTGLKSIHHNLDFVAETTTADGSIKVSDGSNMTDGEVLLFEINQEGTAFDTLSTNVDNQGNFTFGNIVIGDYLAVARPDEATYPDEVPTYYVNTDLWEEADTLLIDTNNPSFEITTLLNPKEQTGNGEVFGVIEEELDDENSGGRVEVRGRVRGAGVSMRRARRVGRTEDDIVYDLVSFVYSNDNGEFFFENLPTGDYRLNIEYPGFPMDTLSNIDFPIEETKNNDYQLEALVDEGKISVAIVRTTGLLDDIIKKVSIYPNPANDYIRITFTDNIDIHEALNVNIISLTGEQVYSESYSLVDINSNKFIKIPLEQLSSGTYIINMSDQNESLGTMRLAIVK